MVFVYAIKRWINLEQVETIAPMYNGTILIKTASGETLRVTEPEEVEEIRQRVAEKPKRKAKADD